MSCKIVLLLCAIICLNASLEAASLRAAGDNKSAVFHKLDYEGVEANARSARQTHAEDDSGEDSDEDDEEDDAELQHQEVIRRQQAYEQSVDDSHEGSNEDNEEHFEADDDEYFGRRIRREVAEAVSNNEIEKSTEREASSTVAPAATSSISAAPNAPVLILIRDVIKKVTELSNSQQVATSAQQYFQLFQHFLQQTIEQVIGDDDDEDEAEAEATTLISEVEKESVTEESGTTDSTPVTEATSEKTTSIEQEALQPEKKPEEDNVITP